MDIVERLIAYRDRAGRSREGRDLLAEAASEIDRLKNYNFRLRQTLEAIRRMAKESA
jgi:hypothetical protein